jgi:hypothetical protein
MGVQLELLNKRRKMTGGEEMARFLNMWYPAIGIIMVAATPAFAQQSTPWEMPEGSAHVVDMQGNMKVMKPSDRTMATLKKRAKPVPRGTVFFMNAGQLYMTQGSKSLFDNF